MISNSPSKPQNVLWADLLLVAFLIGFDALARIVVHAPNFSPLLASALFAGTVLRVRPLALIVPVSAPSIAASPAPVEAVAIAAAVSIPSLAAKFAVALAAALRSRISMA